MEENYDYFSVVQINDTKIVTGGCKSGCEPVKTAHELYNNSLWLWAPDLPEPRGKHASILLPAKLVTSLVKYVIED